MSRISIDVTPEEHQRLKALAALQGKTIKEFVLDRTLGDLVAGSDEAEALAELELLLHTRLENARAGGVSDRSVRDIIEHVQREGPGPVQNG